MKFLRFSFAFCALLSLGVATPALAQLGLLNMTKAADQRGSAPPPPAAGIIDPRSLGESNYNIVPIGDTARRPLVAVASQQSQRAMATRIRLDTLAQQNSRALRALQALATTANSAAISRLRSKLQRSEDSLKRVITSQAKLVNQADSARARADLELRQEHFSQLGKLLTSYEDNIKLYGDTLKPSDRQLLTIENFFTTYWKVPPVAGSIPLVFASDSAQNDLQFKYLPQLKSQNAELHRRYEHFKALAPSLKKLRQDLAAEITYLQSTSLRPAAPRQSDYRARYNNLTAQAQSATDSLLQSFQLLENTSRRYNAVRQAWETTFKTRKDRGKDDNISALPAVTSVPGTRLLVPEISAIGSRRVDSGDKSYLLALKLFTALGNATAAPANRDRGTERLFIRDASSFGFSADATFGFVPAAQSARHGNTLAITLGGAYLDKLMTPDTTRNYSVGTASFRAGIEWAPIPQALSFYGNLTGLSFLTNRAALQRDYTQPKLKDVYSFATLGVRAMLTLDQNKTSAIELDLGFILKGDNVRAFVPNDDLTITTIRATIIKNFSLN